jgi:pimeloyl-ACP methyl ester carboxylesterase
LVTGSDGAVGGEEPELSLSTGSSTWTEWGGNGPGLHFAHGNGFPPGTYKKLIGVLQEQYRVCSMAARPLWSDEPPESLHSWSQLAGDLSRELDRQGMRGAVGVGHSLGAAMSMLAAVEDSQLFSALVLIDPLILTGSVSLFWGLVKRLGLGGRLGLVQGARSRRQVWPSREVARRIYRSKPTFASWDPEVLDDYLAAGLTEDGNGMLRLRYPRAWEARIFEISPHNLWPRLRRLAVPVIFIRGETSDTFLANAAARLRRELPAARVLEVPETSHFVPMERPLQLGRTILGALAQLQLTTASPEPDRKETRTVCR